MYFEHQKMINHATGTHRIHENVDTQIKENTTETKFKVKRNTICVKLNQIF